MDKESNEILGAFDEWKEEKSTQHDMIEDVKKKSELGAASQEVNSFGLYNKIYNENILLMYKGAITFDLVTSVIETLDRKVNMTESDKKVQKLFYSAAVECVHNLYHHMDEVKGQFSEISEHDAKSGLITVIAKEKYYNIITGNFIPTKHTYDLKDKIEEVNNTDKNGLRTLYKETLSNGEFSEKGTAGLGLIQLARKTGERLNYKFDKVNSEYSYFTFQIKINRF
ncbi:SiaB family protein kinase [Reichenbachiella carrageenanivorans]|uniref:SiaB family protein kinase n=1 Tax=Reichenbachiella carrageenanivorans TaxID=2979869 RepID=A0ABY6CUQ9_9BACT|nr:SiaB family protein kinase [Reichenbachiella carrageenanivorans]UXX77646.1 SiaB family protein kinase [Reichenbachiella carrageenanivorans]